MLLNIYDLITKLQTEIGNAAEVWLFVRDDVLELRVDWRDDDFHARHRFSKFELENLKSEEEPLNYFVAWCKKEYAVKKSAG